MRFMTHLRFAAIIAALLFLVSFAAPGRAQEYPLTADSEVQPNVPKGEVTYFKFKGSKIFPGTERDCWLYIPKQYDGAKPACVMVFQDGGGFQDNGGGFRVPIVFDNLIAKGEMPVTIGVFVSPGVVPAADEKTQLPRYNRSFEYDAVDDRYARFLIEEILPEVGKKVKITDDPNGRAISGASSGGIAFVAAWERPDSFRRVLSFIGSFTDLRGGQRYGALIRKSEPKPLRVFLQDGSNDQDIYSGNWFIGNNDVSAALKFAGYETQYVVGTRGHDGVQGRAILPDALRWLWKDYPKPIGVGVESRQPVMNVLIPGEAWQPVTAPDDASFIGIMTSDPAGNVYATDAKARIWKIAPDGTATEFQRGFPAVSALAFGPDNRLYAAQNIAKRLTAFDSKGSVLSSLKWGMEASALTVTHSGTIYAAEARTGRLWRIGADGKKTKLDAAIPGTTSLQLTPDQSLLLISPRPETGKFVFSFRIAPDGSLTDGQPYFDLFQTYGSPGTGALGTAVDTEGVAVCGDRRRYSDA